MLLALGTVITFWPSVRCDYISYDDPDFITSNVHVQQGLNPEGIKSAFTDVVASNWHPVTMLTFVTGWQLWGYDPASDHLFDLLLHALNSVVLFLLMRRLTGTLWRSAAVAALFAFHPMRVESVTWIAERKDLLSALFFFVSIWVYADWVKHRRSWRYALLIVLFALGLMSKPMVVTLPFVLLLIDYWPLNRTLNNSTAPPLWKLLVEKLPLFALSAAACAITVFAQQHAGSVVELEQWPLAQRFSNVVMAYWRYIEMFVWPANLGPLYLPLAKWSMLWVSIALLMLIFVSAAIGLRAKRSPLSTGWFWFIGMLVPVIGIIQVGSQSMADRYSYLPFIGLSLIVVWQICDAVHTNLSRALAAASIVAALGLFAFRTHEQIGVWKNSQTVFARMIELHPKNPVAHNGLGAYYVNIRSNHEAIAEFEKALSIVPNMVDAHNNLGTELARLQRDDEAITHFRASIDSNPRFEMAHNNLAKLFEKQGKLKDAIAEYRKSLEISPDQFISANELGVCYFNSGDIYDAIKMFSRAVDLAKNNPAAHANLGKAYFAAADYRAALEAYRGAVALAPGNADAQFHFGLLLAIQNDPVEAERHLREALRLKPNFADAESALARLREQRSPGR
ncbi:MAG: tetratricopeptide repeat protein [Limisphaerales bacterium]